MKRRSIRSHSGNKSVFLHLKQIRVSVCGREKNPDWRLNTDQFQAADGFSLKLMNVLTLLLWRAEWKLLISWCFFLLVAPAAADIYSFPPGGRSLLNFGDIVCLFLRLLIIIFIFVCAQVQPQVVQRLTDGQVLLPPVRDTEPAQNWTGWADILLTGSLWAYLLCRCWSSSCLCSRLLVSRSSASSLWVWRHCASFLLASSSTSFSWRFSERILWFICNHQSESAASKGQRSRQ